MVDTELEAYTTRFIPSSGRNFTGLCLVLANLVEMVPLQVRWMPASAQSYVVSTPYQQDQSCQIANLEV